MHFSTFDYILLMVLKMFLFGRKKKKQKPPQVKVPLVKNTHTLLKMSTKALFLFKDSKLTPIHNTVDLQAIILQQCEKLPS